MSDETQEIPLCAATSYHLLKQFKGRLSLFEITDNFYDTSVELFFKVPDKVNRPSFSAFSIVQGFRIVGFLSIEMWKTRAVRLKSLKIFKNATDTMTPKEQALLVSDLERRLARGEMPKIIFSSLIPSGTIMGMIRSLKEFCRHHPERCKK